MASHLPWGGHFIRSWREANALAREIVVLLDGLAQGLGSSADRFGNPHYNRLRSECVRLRKEIASISLETPDAVQSLDEARRSLHHIRTALVQLREARRMEMSWQRYERCS